MNLDSSYANEVVNNENNATAGGKVTGQFG